MFRFFECVESRFARDRREPFQKLFQGFSSFEVVEQVLDRQSRAPKDRHSTQDLGVFHNDAIHGIHTVFQYLSLVTRFRCQFSAKGALTRWLHHLKIPSVLSLSNSHELVGLKTQAPLWIIETVAECLIRVRLATRAVHRL